MTLMNPAALVLLLSIPLIAYVGWPRNRFRRTRDGISLFLRALMILLVVLALADLEIVRASDRLAVIFLIDVSDSMDAAAQEAAEQYIHDSLSQMPPNDLAGVIAFGADAQVARSVTSVRELGPIRVAPQTGHTNLAGAIRLGLALFPGDTARRMIVLSDGQPTIGDTIAAAQLSAVANVEISFVPFTRAATPEVQVREVLVPTILNEHQEFNLTTTIVSEVETRATITVQASGEIVSRQESELHPGENIFTLRLRSGDAGFHEFTVQVDTLQDGFYQNNTLDAFSRVEGAPRVLLVSSTAGAEETRYIVPALQENGLVVDTMTPAELPIGLAGLADYDSVVLVNIPATELSDRTMDVLRSFVGDLGGGLVVIGGDQAYGLGGYYQTPLEEALPVEMRLLDQERMPQLTIAYVIDRSGSMGIANYPGGPSNLELAKEAIRRSVNFLQPTDRAGIAGFDVNAYWLAEFQEVSNGYELQRLAATLRSGGGTSIMAGMQLVSRDIVVEESPLKHIILLTDGGADPQNLVTMAQALNQDHNVTTSVVSIGSFNSRYLPQMAEVGGGHYHHIEDPESIPTIFAQETVLATRAYIQEEQFNPVLSAVHPIMQGIEAIPPLLGYVATTPRAATQVILRSPESLFEDPILATWQYGLGRSVAFTSDATGQWGQHWVTWDDFSRFWSQVVRWTITEGATNNLETRVVMEDEQARILVDARDNDGGFLNGLDLLTSVVLGNAENMQRIHLRQVAPGRYEGVFTPTDEGAYLLRVNQASDANDPIRTEGLDLSQTTGWVMSYSPEYDIRESPDGDILETIAQMTDGRDLSALIDGVFDHNIEAQKSFVPLWPWLLLAVLLLLPFDIAVRRLLITRSDLQRVRQWLFGREIITQPVGGDRLEVLRQARNRARERLGTPADRGAVDHEEDAGEPASVRRTISALRSRKSQTRARQEASKPQDAPPAKPSYTPPRSQPGQIAKPPEPSRSIGQLLQRRRKREDDEENGE